LEDFREWHTIVNSQIERDEDFRNFIVSVWKMETSENINPVAGGIMNVEISKKGVSAREMYRHDFHRVTFGQDPIISHPLSTNYPEEEPKPITGGADLRYRPLNATEEKP